MKKFLVVTVMIMALTANGSVHAAMRMASPNQVGALSALQIPKQAGTLTCTVRPGSDQHATCVFNHPVGQDTFSETYDTKFTQALAGERGNASQTMHWAVFTPGGKANPGMLLGARPDNSVAKTAVGGARVELSFQNEGQRITFRPMDGSSGAASKADLQLGPSPLPIVLKSNKSLQLTVMH